MVKDRQGDALGSPAVLPNPIDRYVGSRIRLRRNLSGISQVQLAAALGLTFQQVQKYENGRNCVSASRLFEISRELNVSISHFYDEMPSEISNRSLFGSRLRENGNGKETKPNLVPDDRILSRETLDLVRAYCGAPSDVRRHMRALIDSLAAPEAGGYISKTSR
jgi:transcriptional regulator with XRE-family HTH domain